MNYLAENSRAVILHHHKR